MKTRNVSISKMFDILESDKPLLQTFNIIAYKTCIVLNLVAAIIMLFSEHPVKNALVFLLCAILLSVTLWVYVSGLKNV